MCQTANVTCGAAGVSTHEPQCPDVEVAHAPLAVVGLVVAALVGVDDAVVATFDLDAFTRPRPQVRVLAQPFIGARHQHAAHTRRSSSPLLLPHQ